VGRSLQTYQDQLLSRKSQHQVKPEIFTENTLGPAEGGAAIPLHNEEVMF
jgi:hypothetical protein